MPVFVDDPIKLTLDTSRDVSGFSVLRVKYKRPDGVTGYWEAGVCPTDNKKIQVDLTNKLSIHGTWLVQAYVSNGTEGYHGMWAELKVLSPITS